MTENPIRPRAGTGFGLTAALLLALLQGCATLPPPADTAQRERMWDAHRAHVEIVDSWNLQGRAAFSSPQGGGNIALEWLQTGAVYDIQFKAPLGRSGLRMTGSDAGVVIVDDAGRQARSTDPEALLLEMTGWRLPLHALQRWVRGLPAAQDESIELDDNGHLARLESGGWEIDYRAYTEVGELFLPRRMNVRGPDMELRLVIDQWQIAPR
jgi:outer membrane lipoprotein LolB